MNSPVSASSIATRSGIWSGSIITPPAAATSPRLASGMPNLASLVRHHEIAGDHQLQPACQRVPLDRGDQRLGGRLLDDPAEAAPLDARAFAAQETLEVHSRAERAPRAGEDAHTQIVLGIELVHRRRDPLGRGLGHRVLRLGPVYGDDQHAVTNLAQDFVHHLFHSRCLWKLFLRQCWRGFTHTSTVYQRRDEMPTSYANLIDGEMVSTSGTMDVINPATEEVIGTVPACGEPELDRAVAAARKAFKSWRATPVDERRRVINAMADVIASNHEELYRLLTAEQGKPHAQAKGEMYGAAGMMKAQSTLSLEEVVNQDDETRLSRTRRVPVGVVGGIVPWNFPVMMAVQKIAPALLAGCTIVLKPSPFTPLTTLRIAELWKDIAPAGVVNIITGEGQPRPADHRAPRYRQDHLHRLDRDGQEDHGRRIEGFEADHAGAGRKRRLDRAPRCRRGKGGRAAVLVELHQRRADLRGGQAHLHPRGHL